MDNITKIAALIRETAEEIAATEPGRKFTDDTIYEVAQELTGAALKSVHDGLTRKYTTESSNLSLLKQLDERTLEPALLQAQFDILEHRYTALQASVKSHIVERVALGSDKKARGKIHMKPGEDLTAALDRIAKQFDAAKKGLGFVNKLPKGQDRTNHAKRVMGNLNTIRAAMKRVTTQIGAAL